MVLSSTSAIASSAPASLSRIARLPSVSTPSCPAQKGCIARALASPASRTALGRASGWKRCK
uniref:Uncharacterized protein n=1 Tax=Arundo donax TaxID=35708 RepID=A0A0A9B4J0_ARUDO